MKHRKTKTKVERLSTALYQTHYNALTSKMRPIVGEQVDDLVSELGERLVRNAERWDGDDSRVFSYLYASLYRLALNRRRNERRTAYECDRHPDAPSEWDIWTDRRDNPEALCIADDLREKWRAATPYSELFDHLADGGRVFEFCAERGLNSNTTHSHVRMTRELIHDIDKRLEGAGCARGAD